MFLPLILFYCDRYASGHIPNTMLWVGRNIQDILAESRVLFKDFNKKKVNIYNTI